MKLIPVAHELISNMRAFFQVNTNKPGFLNEEPLRAELFSTDQMERFGKSLAKNHRLNTLPAEDHLLKRLADNDHVLNEVRRLLTDSIKSKYQISPAGEWLVDNFYLLEEHIRIAKTHFPKKYSEGLPRILDGATPGETRIYDIVLEIISHSDGKIDIGNLSTFLKAYQTVTHLELGELWAIPIMLRLATIENIRRVSARIAIDRVDRNLAYHWASQMIETAEKDPKSLILVIADMARSSPPMVSAFVSELTRQLQGKGPALALSLNWIEQHLSESGLTGAELVNAESQKQAADQVSMSNGIGSLRSLAIMDWRDFVEANSIVEQTLREDNNGIYGLMDFHTRDRYRHVVENIAKKSNTTEYEVAQLAIKLTKKNINEAENIRSHVGYFLIGDGGSEIKRLVNMKVSTAHKIRVVLRRNAFKVYIFFVSVIMLALVSAFFLKAHADTNNNWLLFLITFLLVICGSQLAISVVNFFASLWVKPSLLPRMDFSKEVPPKFRTLVVVPAMLSNVSEIENLVEALEVRFLANRNNNLYYGLLTDFYRR